MNKRTPILPILSVFALAACGGPERTPTAPFTPSDGPTNPTNPTDPTDPTDPVDPTDPLGFLPAPQLPGTLLDYSSDLPPTFDAVTVRRFDNTPGDNPVTDEGATLGRVLFYDLRLSRNGTKSCASCHPQATAFSDTDRLSEGFEGGRTGRNSMPLLNVAFYPRGSMFWDERAASLEEQVLMPIQDEVEMGMTLPDLVERLEGTDYYPPLFEAAFGDPAITSDRISLALAQFVRSIVSYRSRWDQGVAQVEDVRDAFPNFTAQENRGKDIFFGQRPGMPNGMCATCHLFQNPVSPPPPGTPPGAPTDNLAAFFMSGPKNNGLFDGDDNGFGDVSGRPQDDGKFKSPSLRNIAQTAPYMHDGRFATLERVVQFYDREIEAHPNLDPVLRNPQNGQPVRLNLGPDGVRDLVAFLETLTDTTIADDERWSDPFGNDRR